MSSLSPDLNLAESAFHKTEGRKSLKQAATESGCSKNLAQLLRGGNPEYGIVLEFQAVIDC